MSVMACDRKDCQHIMCDKLINWKDNTRSYICYTCLDELKEFRKTWPESMSEDRVETLVRQFMDTPIGTHIVLDSDGIEAKFKKMLGEHD